MTILKCWQILTCVQRVRCHSRGFCVDWSNEKSCIQYRLSHRSLHEFPVRPAYSSAGLSQLACHCRSQTQWHLPPVDHTMLSTATNDLASTGSCELIDAVYTQYYTGSGRHCHHLHCCSCCGTHCARHWHRAGTVAIKFISCLLSFPIFLQRVIIACECRALY